MKRFILFLVNITLFTVCYAQGNFTMPVIPADMLVNADAVIRNDSMGIEIVSPAEAYITEYREVTILNDKGYAQACYSHWYDKFLEVEIKDAVLYNKNGGKVRSLKKGDIKDEQYVDYSIANDNRYKYFDFKYADYPFTVVYTIRIKIKSLFFLPQWHPQSAYNVSVLKSTVTCKFPSELVLKYRTYNISESVKELKDGDVHSIELSVKNLAARQIDKLQVPVLYSSPTLVMVPQNFKLETYSGDFSSWEKMGSFYYKLNSNRDALPAAIKQVVHQLTDTCKTQKCKIDLLYNYLQDNTRYVSIQLGIGGWQTFDANSVAANNYGDCKALSNYMVALLKEANITAYPALVNAGEGKKYTLQKDFAKDIFNHVIVCVPNGTDHIWLECTADNFPAGYLSDFTDDRDVLLITPQEGKLIHTPKYGPGENYQSSKTDLLFLQDGQLKASSDIRYSGVFRDNEFLKLDGKDDRDIRKYLNSKHDFPNYELLEYKYSDDLSASIPVLSEYLTYKGQAAITETGNRVFISSFLNALKCDLPVSYENRSEPFHIEGSYCIKDTTTLHLHTAYKSEYMPAKIDVSHTFGKYQCQYVLEGDSTLKVIREYTQVNGNYDASLYADYLKFRNKVMLKSTAQKVVLIKKT